MNKPGFLDITPVEDLKSSLPAVSRQVLSGPQKASIAELGSLWQRLESNAPHDSITKFGNVLMTGTKKLKGKTKKISPDGLIEDFN
jgi:hypothetical protein